MPSRPPAPPPPPTPPAPVPPPGWGVGLWDELRGGLAECFDNLVPRAFWRAPKGPENEVVIHNPGQKGWEPALFLWKLSLFDFPLPLSKLNLQAESALFRSNIDQRGGGGGWGGGTSLCANVTLQSVENRAISEHLSYFGLSQGLLSRTADPASGTTITSHLSLARMHTNHGHLPTSHFAHGHWFRSRLTGHFAYARTGANYYFYNVSPDLIVILSNAGLQ